MFDNHGKSNAARRRVDANNAAIRRDPGYGDYIARVESLTADYIASSLPDLTLVSPADAATLRDHYKL